jgi:NADPH:quinone reductase-like Zn-dependent oxidoreductase
MTLSMPPSADHVGRVQARPTTRHYRVVVTRHGGPDVLELVEEPLPEPRPGEVRVRVLAAGVSAYDLMYRRTGALPGTPSVPFTPGEDVVGLVDALGAGVEGLDPGQRVGGTTLSLGVGGGYAEYVCLPARELVPVPEGLDPAEAVCLIINYLTAYSALHQTARVRGGERILVQGAAGGVGTALLDLGKAARLEMYGTASKHNHGVVASYGATPIDYRTEDLVRRIRELTGSGVDAAFDPIGGARQVWRSYRALRRGGRLVWFGVAAHKKAGSMVIPLSLGALFLLKLLPDGRRALTSTDYSKDNAWYRTTLARLFAWLAAGRLTPLVADRVPLAEAARAHDRMERGRYAGKLVLVAGA